MRLQPLTESVIDLNFMPMEDIKHLPCLVAQNCRFAGFEDMDQALYLKQTLEEALLIYKKLTLPELARLHQAVIKNKVPLNWELLLRSFNLKWSQDLQKLFEILPQTKLSFQNWASIKDCGLNELQILTWAYSEYPLEKIDKLLNFIAQINPSRQIGVKILEYALEKFNDIHTDELYNINQPDKAYNYCYRLRFPETFKKDDELKAQVLSLPWPAHVKALPIRQADRSGIEIKFFASNFEDYEKKVNGLLEIKQKIKETLWNKN